MVARHLSAAHGGRAVWTDSCFEVHDGEFVAVLGPNGSGKSTLLRVLLGLLRPASGEVELFGRAVRRGNPLIGYVPQGRVLDPDVPVRGRDLVRMGIDGHLWGVGRPGRSSAEVRRRVDQALDEAGATGYADRPAGRLSGGEQQRLLLAQALIGDPRILLLDEPLAHLDPANQAAMTQLVSRVARRKRLTVLLIAHDINPLLGVVDRVIYVAQGRIAIGRPDELITSEALSRTYGAPVEVLRDSRGRVFVVGLEGETSHPHMN